MNFNFSQDELDLRDGAREYLRGRCTREVLRKLVERESADLGSWPELVEMGLVAFLVPEDCGGLGLSDTGFALLAEEAGYVALPEPLIDVAGVAAPALAALGNEAVAQVTAGETRVLTAHGLNPYVNQLRPTDSVLQFADGSVNLIDTADIESEAIDSIDPLRYLSKINTANSTTLPTGDDASQLASQAALRGAVFTAAELLGLTAAMIDMSTEYVKERKQFGVAIGTFQAVKHHLSTAFTKLEFARPVVYRAAASLRSGNNRAALDAAHAKIAATDAAINAAEASIQVHGGIGYTFEADLHLWMKRVWALAGLWGDRNHHMNVVDRAVFDSHVQLGPAATF
ncbi:MAG: acyl-CoA dehydrogenase family protein [Gammaproteobacteria bacterium]